MKHDAPLDELLDIMKNDSENLERVVKLLTDDCIWVMEPGGSEYHGATEIRSMAGFAMGGRSHDTTHTVEILNWFADDDNLCIEYTHGALLTGKGTGGIKASVKTGTNKYCMTYHVSNGKIDRVHEYINSSSQWWSFLLPIALNYLHWRLKRKLDKNRNL